MNTIDTDVVIVGAAHTTTSFHSPNRSERLYHGVSDAPPQSPTILDGMPEVNACVNPRLSVLFSS